MPTGEHRIVRRFNMIVEQNHPSLVWGIECLCTCQLLRHVKLINLLDHSMVHIKLLNRATQEFYFDQWIGLTCNQSELRTIKFVNAQKKFLISFGLIILRSRGIITKKLILGHLTVLSIQLHLMIDTICDLIRH